MPKLNRQRRPPESLFLYIGRPSVGGFFHLHQPEVCRNWTMEQWNKFCKDCVEVLDATHFKWEPVKAKDGRVVLTRSSTWLSSQASSLYPRKPCLRATIYFELTARLLVPIRRVSTRCRRGYISSMGRRSRLSERNGNSFTFPNVSELEQSSR